MVFAGDFWQLTPVRSHSLFSNTYLNGYTNEEQKKSRCGGSLVTSCSIQRTSMRSKDAWLNAVLNANRYGEETWEMYCFQHGLPTRNPGSWLPGPDKPACGNAQCARLAAEVWPALRERSATAFGGAKARTGCVVPIWSAASARQKECADAVCAQRQAMEPIATSSRLSLRRLSSIPFATLLITLHSCVP